MQPGQELAPELDLAQVREQDQAQGLVQGGVRGHTSQVSSLWRLLSPLGRRQVPRPMTVPATEAVQGQGQVQAQRQEHDQRHHVQQQRQQWQFPWVSAR